MAENQKKDAIKSVLDRIVEVRNEVGATSENSAGGTALAASLSDAWTSTKAAEIETEIIIAVDGAGGVIGLAGAWQELEDTTRQLWASEPDEVDEDSVEARWFGRSAHAPGFYDQE